MLLISRHALRGRGISKRDARYQLGLPEQDLIALCLAPFDPQRGNDLTFVIGSALSVPAISARIWLVLAGEDHFNFATVLREAARRSGTPERAIIWPNPSPTARSLLHLAADVYLNAADAPWSEGASELLLALSISTPVVSASNCAGCAGLSLRRIGMPLSYAHLSGVMPMLDERRPAGWVDFPSRTLLAAS